MILSTDKYEQFKEEGRREIRQMGSDDRLVNLTNKWINAANQKRYSYHFEWMGRPIIQYPQDIVAMQEIIWRVKPDLIIETGIAHGGSLVLYASMLELLETAKVSSGGRIIGIDIDIRAHNREALESHPMSKRIELIQGSSVDPQVLAKVKLKINGAKKIMVVLDSNHTHEHVLSELELYWPFVSDESYLVVFDTIVEYLDESGVADRPWGKGNNPMTAVHQFLETNKNFAIDREIQDKLLITVAPNGYLKRISR